MSVTSIAHAADAQPDHPEQCDQRVRRRAALPGRGQHRGELQRVQHRPALGLPRHLRPGHRDRRVGVQVSVDDGVLENPAPVVNRRPMVAGA